MEEKKVKKPCFSDLYGYFCGMISLEKTDVLYDQMMGAIPDLGVVKGDIYLINQNKSKDIID